MTKAKMPDPPKTDEDEIKQLDSLLDDVPGSLADLTREGGGYTINVIYLPELAKPTEAHVTILGAGKDGDKPVLDTLKGVELDKVWDVLDHPTKYSEGLLLYLGGKERKAKAKK